MGTGEATHTEWMPLQRRPGGVPTPPRPLIGRAREVEDIRARLLEDETRLLTLTGPGGVGKTRLALAAAGALLHEFLDAVYFIDLSGLDDAALVPATVAEAVGARETSRQDAIHAVVRTLNQERVLLLLDNFEHLLAAAEDVGRLLAACPRLTVLATSREPLRLLWEQEMPLDPLAVPSAADTASADVVARTPATALFVQRARAVLPSFQLTDQNAGVVAQVCARLDGLPLAIELAAARVKLLSPEALLARLDARLDLLQGKERERSPRHRTLRAAIDWSYSLLPPDEQQLLRRLGVFVGGCSLEAAEAVCGGSVDTLSALMDRSLIQRQEVPSGAPRVRLLETIRAYALDRLEQQAERSLLGRAHANYFLDLFEGAAVELRGPRQIQAVQRIGAEIDNLRVAFRWALDSAEPEVAARFCWGLFGYFYARGHYREAARWTAEVQSQADALPPVWRARVSWVAGGLAYELGEYAPALSLLTQSLELFEALDDAYGAALARWVLGYLTALHGDVASAHAHLTTSRTLFEQIGDGWGQAQAWTARGAILLAQGAYQEALTCFDASLSLSRRGGDPMSLAQALGNAAWALGALGDTARAVALAREGAELAQLLGSPETLAFCVEGWARAMTLRGAHEHAAQLLGAAEGLREACGAPVWPAQQALYDATVSDVRAQLGADAFERARAAGRSRPFAAMLEEVAAHELSTGGPPPPQASRASVGLLSPREEEVAALIAAGLTSREIAERLVISEATADTHAAHIRTKLGLRSRAEIAAWAIRHGLPDRSTG